MSKISNSRHRRGGGTRCLIPWFDGAIFSLEWKEANTLVTLRVIKNTAKAPIFQQMEISTPVHLQNELFNGQGTYSYANGDQYIGEFRGLYGMYICRLRQMGVSEGSSLPYSHLK